MMNYGCEFMRKTTWNFSQVAHTQRKGMVYMKKLENKCTFIRMK